MLRKINEALFAINLGLIIGLPILMAVKFLFY